MKPTIVVAGSSGALGEKLVFHLLNLGFDITACCNARSSRDRLEAKIQPSQLESISFFVGDLSTQEGYSQLLSQLGTDNKAPMSYISTIGAFSYNHCESTTEEEFDVLLSLNMKSHWLATKNLLPIMRKQDYGNLIFVSSLPSLSLGTAGMSLYLASKAALNMFVRCVAKEISNTKININLILPGTIDTPANRKSMGDDQADLWIPPIEICKNIAKLIGLDAINVNGAFITIPDRV